MKTLRLLAALLLILVGGPLFIGGGFLLDLARRIGGLPYRRWRLVREAR